MVTATTLFYTQGTESSQKTLPLETAAGDTIKNTTARKGFSCRSRPAGKPRAAGLCGQATLPVVPPPGAMERDHVRELVGTRWWLGTDRKSVV